MPLPDFENLPNIPQNLTGRLLAVETLDEQAVLLRGAGLLNANGLAALLEVADQLAGDDPTKTWQLATLAEHVTDEADAPAAHPRAAYLRGYVHAMRGQFDDARTMVEMARAGYESLGMELEALRTNVGLMRILGELGEVHNALQVGQDVLSQIEQIEDVSQNNIEQLKALVYQNRGIGFERLGLLGDALLEYESSERFFQNLQMYDHVAMIADNQGLIFLGQGHVQQAITSFEKAQRFYREAHLFLFEAETLINLGEVYLLTSDYLRSLSTFEEAHKILDELDELSDHSILLRHVGDAYLALNLYGESRDAYRQAIPFLENAGLAHHLAHAYWSLGIVSRAQHQFEESAQTFAQAVSMFRQQQNTQILSAVLLEQSALATAMDDTATATALAEEALQLVEKSEYTVQKIYAYLRNAELVLAAIPPDLTRAETLLNQAQPLVDALGLPQLRLRLQGRWGHFYRLQKNDAAAEEALRAAIDEIEVLRSTLIQERMRASFLDDKLIIYQELITFYLERNEPDDITRAFEIAERAKSRALADLLSGAIQAELETMVEPTEVEGAPTNDTEADTQSGQGRMAQLQILQTELNAIYNEMLGDGTTTTDDDDPHARTISSIPLKERAVELEQSISRLQLQNSVSRTPQRFSPKREYHPTFSSNPLMANAISNHAVATEVTLIIYHVIDQEILAFVQSHGRPYVFRMLSTIGEIEPILQRLNAQWTRFQAGQRFTTRHQQQMERSVRRILGELYRTLMAPLLTLLDDVAAPHKSPQQAIRKLAIVPHGLLHQLPFHALHDGERYLMESCAISYAPSATVFALSQQRPLTLEGQPLILGIPDQRIPAAGIEVQRVATHLQERGLDPCTHVGEAASLKTLSTHTSGTLFHFACHGLFRNDNPMFSALKLHGGWLTANEAAQLRLPPSLVTLSACESGRSGALGGSEILGLTYAFLSAGASALLVSQWLVQDDAAALLMDCWYAQLAAGVDLAETLRQAQLQVKTQYPHPYYWAPFLLVGKRNLD